MGYWAASPVTVRRATAAGQATRCGTLARQRPVVDDTEQSHHGGAAMSDQHEKVADIKARLRADAALGAAAAASSITACFMPGSAQRILERYRI